MKRRDLLRWGAAGALALTSGVLRRSFASSSTTKAPSFVQISLDGGVDAILTADPKTPSEVEHWVDRPYSANEITGGVGPQWKPLAPWIANMAVLHAVEVGSANHESANVNMWRLRTTSSPRMPTIFDLIGQQRTQPIGSIALGFVVPADYSPDFIADTIDHSRVRYHADLPPSLLDLLDKTPPDEMKVMSHALATEADRMHRAGVDPITIANARSAADLIDRFAAAPAYAMPQYTAAPDGKPSFDMLCYRSFSRTLWLLENDLVRSIFVRPISQVWDSHSDNLATQRTVNASFAPAFAWFLGELDKRAPHTVLMVGSELGRYPRLNAMRGKDHFPQTPYLLRGPGIASGSFSPTGRRMESLAISLDTGKPSSTGQHLSLDHLGATILTLAGLQPSLYGYDAAPMKFLLT